jgi:dihydroorotase-like cyclic amidohydrolase
MKRTLIQNATIVNEGRSVRGSVVIEGEKIAEVLEKGQKPAIPCEETINANGCYLIPGVIDDHVHFRDPGLTHKADISTESRAAAAGGVTSNMVILVRIFFNILFYILLRILFNRFVILAVSGNQQIGSIENIQ